VRAAGGVGTRELYSVRDGRERWRAPLPAELARRLAADPLGPRPRVPGKELATEGKPAARGLARARSSSENVAP
jgi:hypothetical protein